MTLSRLVSRKSLTVLGINSGTSADSVDLSVVRITRSGTSCRTKFLCGSEKRFPANLREAMQDVSDSDASNLDNVVRCDNRLGMFFGETARRYMSRVEGDGVRVDLVASHGQTVRHSPAKTKLAGRMVRGTMQLGSLDVIARITGSIAVGDFRQADIAVGGEGAPITTGAMSRLFSDPAESRLVVNIGGMSNYFYLPAHNVASAIRAADCGPGNVLCDLLSSRLLGKRLDKHGAVAKTGNLSTRLLSLLLGEPFFTSPTTSTGREQFGAGLADKMIAFGRRFDLPDVDLLRTAVELTTNAIAMSVWPMVRRDKSLRKLYLTGGGRRNRFMVSRLAQHLPDLDIVDASALGVPGDLVEATAYAVMGEACVRSEPLPRARQRSGGRSPAPICGRIAQPPGSAEGER